AVYSKGGDGNTAIGGLIDNGGAKKYYVRIEGDGGRTISLFDTADHAKAGATTFEGGSADAVDIANDTIVRGATAFANGDVFIDHTHATIADNAQINQRGLFTASSAQSVSVKASDEMQTFDVAGALAVSLNSSGFGAAVNVQVLVQDTQASIGAGADVKAGG